MAWHVLADQAESTVKLRCLESHLAIWGNLEEAVRLYLQNPDETRPQVLKKWYDDHSEKVKDSSEATILYDILRLNMKGKGIYAISEDQQKQEKVVEAVKIDE